MHILSILLFPLRLITVPLALPLTGIIYGLTGCNPNSHDTYWNLLWPVTKAWLLWHA